METEFNRKIAYRDFYGIGKHIYEDQLGWTLDMKREACSLVSKKIFDELIVNVGYNLSFFYVDDGNFYGIHSEVYPIECKRFPKDLTKEFVGFQFDGDTHHDGEVLASFNDEHDIWDNFKINGKSLDEVLRRAYIIRLM